MLHYHSLSHPITEPRAHLTASMKFFLTASMCLLPRNFWLKFLYPQAHSSFKRNSDPIWFMFFLVPQNRVNPGDCDSLWSPNTFQVHFLSGWFSVTSLSALHLTHVRANS